MIKQLIEAVRIAGQAILQLQNTKLVIQEKSNKELVTDADLLANNILQDRLQNAFPDIGWLSEESIDDPQRLDNKQVFIVDPIDGTREYAALLPEYAISVALIEAGVPRLGVVFNPATDELFHAVRGEGAALNQQPIHCKTWSSHEQINFLASRLECQRGEWVQYQDSLQIKPLGSIAYKLALIAAGRAHGTGSLGPKHEWDIAAGVLLVSEAGGVVRDKSNHPFVFNQPSALVNGIIATSAQVYSEVFTILQNPSA